MWNELQAAEEEEVNRCVICGCILPDDDHTGLCKAHSYDDIEEVNDNE